MYSQLILGLTSTILSPSCKSAKIFASVDGPHRFLWLKNSLNPSGAYVYASAPAA